MNQNQINEASRSPAIKYMDYQLKSRQRRSCQRSTLGYKSGCHRSRNMRCTGSHTKVSFLNQYGS
jgi:hypothetical protein